MRSDSDELIRTSFRFGTAAKTSWAKRSRSEACAELPGAMAMRMCDVFALVERDALLLQWLGRGRLLDVRIGGPWQGNDHYRHALVAIFEAGERPARRHAGRRREPHAGPAGIDDIGRVCGRRQESEQCKPAKEGHDGL